MDPLSKQAGEDKRQKLYASIIDAVGRKLEDVESLKSCGLKIKKPVAWALYQVWKDFDRRGL